MARSILWREGLAGLPNVGLYANLPTATESLYHLTYWATDLFQTFQCVEAAPGVFAWAPTTPPAVPGANVKPLSNGNSVPLLSIDITKTTLPGQPLPDYTFSTIMMFSVECKDAGNEVQVRAGTANVCLAYKLPTTTFYTNVQALLTGFAASTGTLSTTFTWTTSGTIATLNLTATSSLAPTELSVHYTLQQASHFAFTYIP